MLIPIPRRVRLIKTMRVLFALLLLPLFCHAQQTRTLSCRFLGFQTVEDENSLTCVAPKVELACPFQDAEISPPVMVVAVDNVITFIDTKTRKPACSITVPANLRQAILVLMPAPKSAAMPWRGFPIEDNLKTFPNGGSLVVNMHVASVRFIIGEYKNELKPGGQNSLAMPKERDDFNMATVAFQFNQEEQWVTAKETRMRFTEGLRYLMLCCSDPETKRPIISMYQDHPYVAPPPPPK
jgi:hypothetical protein